MTYLPLLDPSTETQIMSQPTQSPRGKRPLPSLVDDIATTDPHRVLYSITKTQDPAAGFRDITAAEVARGVNRCAWYIEKNLGRGQNFPTLAFIGPQTPIYAILVLAAIKTGYKLLLLSPQNTIEADLSLMGKSDCKTILLPPVLPFPIVGELVQTGKLNIVEVPALEHWLEDGHVEPYPYTKTFEEARRDPFSVMHTSGSTGIPKPIIWTHGKVSTIDSFVDLASLGYRNMFFSMCPGTRLYGAFPVNHGAGLMMLLPASIYAGFTVVTGPFPPTPEIMDSIHVHGNVQISSVAPMMLTNLAKNPSYLENLSRLNFIVYGGGPLPKATGEAVASKTTLFNFLGTTEAGSLPGHLCDPEDWAYLNFSSIVGSDFRPVGDGLYEHFIVRDPKLSRYQAIFETFPDINEWPLKDLYSKHPTKEGLWLYRGRADDMIVYSTNQKLNPLGLEEIINSHPAISAALVIGTGRSQTSLLVEAVAPPTNDVERDKLLDKIWESVEDANSLVLEDKLKIRGDMVIFTSVEKPMLRAGKGTVQRQMTVDAYASELDALYAVVEQSTAGPYPEYEYVNEVNGVNGNYHGQQMRKTMGFRGGDNRRN
ncbi:NRPS-like enzyme [Fusarium austroafricanum]|uniref:NRPS-like enzyme n=1 Tax=Fusarium austroafricanum TaxID=2364996 RepID=A0A8H4NIN7_9HYPO|nr:NRPS-like enzyme [Fusarium austroafricanum]